MFIMMLVAVLWQPLGRLIYPFPYRGVIHSESRKHQLDPMMVAALIRVESSFQTNVRSQRGAYGLMQIMPETAQWVAEQQGLEPVQPGDLSDPEFNIVLGTWYLRYLFQQFDGRLPVILAAYNAGESTVRTWLETGVWDGKRKHIDQIPYEETKRFVRKVMSQQQIYHWLYGSG